MYTIYGINKNNKIIYLKFLNKKDNILNSILNLINFNKIKKVRVGKSEVNYINDTEKFRIKTIAIINMKIFR